MFAFMLIDELLNRLRPQQRHITIGHHHGAREIRDRLQAHLHGVAGAVLFLLHCLQNGHVHVLGDRVHGGGDLVALVAHHSDEVRGVYARGGVQGVGEQAAPTNFVERLLLR